MRANTAFGQGNHCARFELKAGVQSDDAVSRIAGGLQDVQIRCSGET